MEVKVNWIIGLKLEMERNDRLGCYFSWRSYLLHKEITSSTGRNLHSQYYLHRRCILISKSIKRNNLNYSSENNPNNVKSIRNKNNYDFSGMHHIFCEESGSKVSVILFANEDRSLFAFGCDNGKISLCNALPSGEIIRVLQGHEAPITDLCWSTCNDLILSCSEDKTVKVWTVKYGNCSRTISEDSIIRACSFHPLNNNIFFVGTEKGFLKGWNMSTGRCCSKFQANSEILSLRLCSLGELIFAGDSKGFLHLFALDQLHLSFSFVGRTHIASRPITSIQLKKYYHSGTHDTWLLLNCLDSTVKLYRVNNKPTKSSQISLIHQFPIVNISHHIRSRFCPLLSYQDSVCFLTGSEDSVVYVFDVKTTSCINMLQGHSGVVLDVDFNYDESLLGSCDDSGTVILWKRILRPEAGSE